MEFAELSPWQVERPAGYRILIAPVGKDAEGTVAAADPEVIATWRHTVARAGDPWMHVLQLGEAP